VKLYIAGPMRGKPNWNFDEFNTVAQRLRAMGHQVFNPAEIAQAWGYCEGKQDGECRDHLKHVLIGDMACILACDGIVLLDGWRESRGSTVEVSMGQFLGLQFYRYSSTHSRLRDYEPPKLPWKSLQELALIIDSGY
jgi:hypothetical protein